LTVPTPVSGQTAYNAFIQPLIDRYGYTQNGVPTGGGVIGTANIQLIDGSTFRLPGSGVYSIAGDRNLENWGIEPDAYVENPFEEEQLGRDRQLERAVQELLGQVRAVVGGEEETGTSAGREEAGRISRPSCALSAKTRLVSAASDGPPTTRRTGPRTAASTSSSTSTKRWTASAAGMVNRVMAGDRCHRPKPASIARPPRYIGFRTQRYGPEATNARGGSNGAGVPRPFAAKSVTQLIARTAPKVMRAAPTIRVPAGHGPPSAASGGRAPRESRPQATTKSDA
jgi:hypothetical protein